MRPVSSYNACCYALFYVMFCNVMWNAVNENQEMNIGKELFLIDDECEEDNDHDPVSSSSERSGLFLIVCSLYSFCQFFSSDPLFVFSQHNRSYINGTAEQVVT